MGPGYLARTPARLIEIWKKTYTYYTQVWYSGYQGKTAVLHERPEFEATGRPGPTDVGAPMWIKEKDARSGQ
jgi:hypothetical protein